MENCPECGWAVGLELNKKERRGEEGKGGEGKRGGEGQHPLSLWLYFMLGCCLTFTLTEHRLCSVMLLVNC